jgi:hypothetical protein
MKKVIIAILISASFAACTGGTKTEQAKDSTTVAIPGVDSVAVDTAAVQK